MVNKFTLCWECAKATGGCRWSNAGLPVKGWTAEFVKANNSKFFDSYHVIECPEFKRDAIKGGTEWYKENK